jgi:hypothetical protein
MTSLKTTLPEIQGRGEMAVASPPQVVTWRLVEKAVLLLLGYTAWKLWLAQGLFSHIEPSLFVEGRVRMVSSAWCLAHGV